MEFFGGVDRDEMRRLTASLIEVQTDLQKMYQRELASNKLTTRLRAPLTDDAATLEIACQAIDDAVNVLTRAFPNVN